MYLFDIPRGVFHEENQKAYNVPSQGQFRLKLSQKKILGAPFKAIQTPIIKGSLNTSKGLTHSAHSSRAHSLSIGSIWVTH